MSDQDENVGGELQVDLKPPDPAHAIPPRFATIEEAFEALESPLLGYARHLLSDPDMAQDLVQEAFLRLHRQFGEVREPRAWLYRALHNLALNLRRHDRHSQAPTPTPSAAAPDRPPADTPDPLPLPDEQIAREEGIGQVRLSLESLDPRSRELIHLKFNDDLSYKEISARTGLKVGYVGYLLHHALKCLAAELTKTGKVP